MEIIGMILIVLSLVGMLILSWHKGRRPKMQEYRIAIHAMPNRPYEELHYYDREVPFETMIKVVTHLGWETAKELAIVQFHSTVPVKVLEDFDFEVTIVESWPTDTGERRRLQEIAEVQLAENFRDHPSYTFEEPWEDREDEARSSD